jgi:hypothetical protein
MKLAFNATADVTDQLPDAAAHARVALQTAARRVGESRGRLGFNCPNFFESVQQVVVIASSSRSGSSMLAEELRRSGRFLHLAGEINPFLRLAGLAWPDCGTSDQLDAAMCSGEQARALQDYISLEVGAPVGADDEFDVEEFDESLYRRLCLQWPLANFTPEEVSVQSARALSELERVRGRRCNWAEDLQLFHALFLRRLRQNRPSINPYYYDLDRSLISRIFTDVRTPSGPPSPVLIEEPPFILVRPWLRWRTADLAEHPLIIKTPSNAYRINFLRALFPSAKLRILHLTRNPAASINGIYDGWRHWGFHAHYVGPSLVVPGYSEPGLTDRGWWKFDLPPGWRKHLRSTLEEICAFQWSSAQSAIVACAGEADLDYQRFRFEDLLTSPESRRRVLTRLFAWVGIGERELPTSLSQPLSPIMATATPRRLRWRDNATRLRTVLSHPTTRRMTLALGYHDESEWI